MANLLHTASHSDMITVSWKTAGLSTLFWESSTHSYQICVLSVKQACQVQCTGSKQDDFWLLNIKLSTQHPLCAIRAAVVHGCQSQQTFSPKFRGKQIDSLFIYPLDLLSTGAAVVYAAVNKQLIHLCEWTYLYWIYKARQILSLVSLSE